MSSANELAIPDGTSFETCQRYLRGFYAVKAYEKPAKLLNVAETVGVGRPTMSKNNAFFIAAGFLIREGDGFKLTSQAAKYLESLDWGLERESKNNLRRILDSYELTQKIISFLSVQKHVTTDELLKRVAIFVGKVSEPRWITGAKAFLDFLFYAEILTETDDRVSYVPLSSIAVEKEIPESKDEMGSISLTERDIIREPYSQDFRRVSVQIQFSITPEMSDEEIIRIVKAIRKGIAEPIKDSGDENGRKASGAD
ncbi:MAG: hypothetical protein ACE5OZ_04095 [Candidatus Heimdallarchaeota archaeon]